MTEWLRIREAARLLHVHENTVRNMLDDGRLRGRVRPGMTYRQVEAASMRRMLDQRTEDADPKERQ